MDVLSADAGSSSPQHRPRRRRHSAFQLHPRAHRSDLFVGTSAMPPLHDLPSSVRPCAPGRSGRAVDGARASARRHGTRSMCRAECAMSHALRCADRWPPHERIVFRRTVPQRRCGSLSSVESGAKAAERARWPHATWAHGMRRGRYTTVRTFHKKGKGGTAVRRPMSATQMIVLCTCMNVSVTRCKL